MPISGINMTYNNTGVMGPSDGDIQIKLKEDHPPTETYVGDTGAASGLFPGTTLPFFPLTLSTNPELRRTRTDRLADPRQQLNANFDYADELLSQVRPHSGVADARVQHRRRTRPSTSMCDRTRAQYVGLTERDVVNSLTVNLSGSGQVAPTYYLNPDNGVNYAVVMQTPQYQIDSLGSLQTLPITSSQPTRRRSSAASPICRARRRADGFPVRHSADGADLRDPQGRDLGGIASDINKVIAATPRTCRRARRSSSGQVQTMNSSFSGLLFGLLGAIVLIYFLIVVNFSPGRTRS